MDVVQLPCYLGAVDSEGSGKMNEHVHEWWVDKFPTEARCVWTDSYGEECRERLNDKQIERRLNATERLSKTSAMAAATTSLRGGDVVSYEDLLAYADALEGEDG